MNNSAAQAPPTQLHAEPTHPRSSARIRAAGRETKLAVAGTAVIAVHVLDDNFLQPQPGTSAADHLVSGLVPVAAARVRDRISAPPRGARAAIAIPLGLLGIVAGIGRRATTASRRARRGTTTPGSSRLQPASSSSGSAPFDPLADATN